MSDELAGCITDEVDFEMELFVDNPKLNIYCVVFINNIVKGNTHEEFKNLFPISGLPTWDYLLTFTGYGKSNVRSLKFRNPRSPDDIGSRNEEMKKLSITKINSLKVI